jgi:hypothetical protein
MTKYKVLQYFQWGRLKLNKGQIIIVTDNGDGLSTVTVEHYPEKEQPVTIGASP